MPDEAAAVIEEMRDDEVEIRPDRKDGERQRRQRDIDEERSLMRRQRTR